MKLKRGILIIYFSGTLQVAYSQLSGNNLMEYQYGNIPGIPPPDVHSVYDQFNIEYRFKGFKSRVRLENFYSTDSTRTHYTKFTQYSLAYRKKGFDLKAGNFYETLGKGLLFRGYEIKNSIYEDRIYRIKQGFYRDAFGFFGSYSNRMFQVKALRAKSLINQLPINSPDNRIDLVTAAETNVKIFNQTLGFILLQNNHEEEKSDYLSAYLSGNLFNLFDYHGEYAHRIGNNEDFFGFENDNSYGAYFNLGYSTSGFGASFELKDYKNLFIGSGISDPPTLVKEHIYKLLNRSTHIPYLYDESGLQLEIFIIPADNHIITINHSRSKNEVSDTEFNSAEYFADWQFSVHSINQFKIYLDYSFDDVVSETARYATGFYFTRNLHDNWSVSLETEFQQLERTFAESRHFQNVYAALVLNNSTSFSTSLIWEFSNDTQTTDLPNTDEVETKQHYRGINIAYKPNRNNTLNLFAGKRRGGPACTSGICYEVLDFKGIEIRWSTKF